MTTFDYVRKNYKTLATEAEKKGITATANKHGVSNWSVYAACEMAGKWQLVPPSVAERFSESDAYVAPKKSKR